MYACVCACERVQAKRFLRGKDPAGAADRDSVQGFLTALFSSVASGAGVVTACAPMVNTCCRCIADFGQWVAQQVWVRPSSAPRDWWCWAGWLALP
jgi:hypothetical protein